MPVFVAVLAGTYWKLMYGTQTATDHVEALLDRLGLHLRNPVRALTAHRIAQIVDVTENHYTADEIRNRFDTLSPDDFPKAYRSS